LLASAVARVERQQAAGKGSILMSKSSVPTAFKHAMMREIYEQPHALADTIARYAPQGNLATEVFRRAGEEMRGRERLIIAASGSSRHAGLAAETMLEDLAGLAVDVEYASEFTYRSTQSIRDAAILVISQSGETADTLAALREAKARGLPTLAITNAPESSMAFEADVSLPTLAGPERAIPATKSFTTQLVVLYSLALFLARLRGRMTLRAVEQHCARLDEVPAQLEGALDRWREQITALASEIKTSHTLLFLGRGVHYPIAREGALKAKESAYVNAEGFPAGELKHGPNALVGANAPLVIIATRDISDADAMVRYGKIIQLMRDLRKQDATMLSIATEGDEAAAGLSRWCIQVPATEDLLSTLFEAVPLQLLAHRLAVENGVNVDAPRNLVKAVVEE
jgi:glutamine---fructose-6-phosphate transaminase (isomerizing)